MKAPCTPDASVSAPESPSLPHVAKRSLKMNAVALMIRLSLAVVLMLSLCSCPLFEKVNALITESKGSRPIGFVVMEPIKYRMDENKKYTQQIGFDEETAGMEKSLKDGISAAAGSRTWSTLWFTDRDFIKTIYGEIFSRNNQNNDAKGFIREILRTLRKQEQTKDFEAMICSVIGSPPNNPDFNQVYAFCYDLAEDKMTYIQRAIPRDQGSVKFQEEMGELITDLCEKLYGESSR